MYRKKINRNEGILFLNVLQNPPTMPSDPEDLSGAESMASSSSASSMGVSIRDLSALENTSI